MRSNSRFFPFSFSAEQGEERPAFLDLGERHVVGGKVREEERGVHSWEGFYFSYLIEEKPCAGRARDGRAWPEEKKRGKRKVLGILDSIFFRGKGKAKASSSVP